MKPLNPIMAVLVIASVGASPLQALTADGKEAVVVAEPTGVAVKVADTDKDSLATLTEILAKNPAAVADAGQRISDFLLKPDAANKSFVSSGVTVKALDEVTRAWVKAQKPGDLAMLYFVIGTGPTAPAWVSNDPLLSKTVLPKREAEDRLRIALARFTEASGAQIKKTGEKAATTAFLNTASVEAKKVFDDKRPKPVVDASVGQNDTTGTKVPDGARGAGSQFGANQYTLKDLYVDGAVVVDVSGAKDEHSRKISMKIFSKRDPATGEIINEIGIFDITDSPKDVFGQRFSIGGGDQSFTLDDRTPGHKKYELKFGTGKNGEATVTFKRPGDGGTPLATTLKDLFVNRADQAYALNNVVKVGDQEFYTVPQGGSASALMMFPKAMIHARGTGDPLDLGPALYAEVGQRGPDGRNQNVKPGKNGGPMLGNVGGKDYKLVFNKDLGLWEVKDGIGDPPASAKPAGDAPAGDAPAGGTPGGTPGGKPQGERSVADLELLFKLAIEQGKCKKADLSQMAKDLEGKFSLMNCNYDGKPTGNQAILLTPASVEPTQQMIISSIMADGTVSPPVVAMALRRGRIVDHHFVLEFERETQYLDLKKKVGRSFEIAGYVANKDASGNPSDPEKNGMTNMTIFIDALRNYMDVPANSAVFVEVPKRVTAKLGAGKRFDVQGKYANGILQVFARGEVGSMHFQVWPEVNMPGGGAPVNGKYSHIGGPTNVFEPEVSSMDEPFKDKVVVSQSFELVLEGSAQKDIALYRFTDPTGKDKAEKYFLSFKYKGNDTVNADPESAKVVKIFRQKFFQAFDESAPLPKDRTMQGLTHEKDPLVRGTLAYRFVAGSSDAKGVLGVFQNPQLAGEGQKDAKANCVGPIVWWGLSNREAALKVCKDDKF